MESSDISQNIGRILNILENTEKTVHKLATDGKAVEERVVRIEQKVEINSHTLNTFWEREWGAMINQMKGVNEKLQEQLLAQKEHTNNSDLIKQQIIFISKTYDNKIAELELITKEHQMQIWKMVGAGAGSGAVVTGLIQLIMHLVK